jgi:hypothetical protein
MVDKKFIMLIVTLCGALVVFSVYYTNYRIVKASEQENRAESCNYPFFELENESCSMVKVIELSSFYPLGNWTLGKTYQVQDDSKTICKQIDDATLECEPKMLTYEVWYREMKYKNLKCNIIKDTGVFRNDFPFVTVSLSTSRSDIYTDKNGYPLNLDVSCIMW